MSTDDPERLDAGTDGRGHPQLLPDFCGIRVVFFVVLLAQLLAFVIVLVGSTGAWRRFDELALTSLLVQWLALSSAAGLCLFKGFLRGLSQTAAMAGALIVVLLIVATVSEVAWQIAARYQALGTLLLATHGEFVFRNLAIATVVMALLLRYLYLQFQWRAQVRAETEARLQALQARIRPHFFFNCMNTIASLIRSSPQQAESAVEDLADLFRASLSDARRLSTLAEEIALCRQYLDIEKLRLGSRLQVHWDIDALDLDAPLPALTLQPLLENAIYHGIERTADGGELKIRGWLEAGHFHLQVDNPIAQAAGKPHEGNQLAQDNIRQRLRAHFGESAQLKTEIGQEAYSACLIWSRTGND